MIRKFYLTVSCLLFIVVQQSLAQAPTIGFQKIKESLWGIVDVVNAGDSSNRLFILQKSGTISIYKNEQFLPVPFLTVPDSLIDAENNNGVLSIAFHPDYKTNGYFFLYYMDSAQQITLARYKVSAADSNVADVSSGVVLLKMPGAHVDHVGCKLNFGGDGYLYFAIGDGSGGQDPNNSAQNTDTLLGKMLRIDVNNFDTPPYYSIPPDNPFVDSSNHRAEIWAIGLRNPWRWSFDRLTHDMWLADVGEGTHEELNFRPYGSLGGENYGWRCYEGNNTFNTSLCTGDDTNYKFPVFSYSHTPAGGYSITGGYVYRGSQYPFLNGYYICADFISQNGWLIKPTGTGLWDIELQNNWPKFINGFGEDEHGELYAIDYGTGGFYKLTASEQFQTGYKFTGNGYWSDPANWASNSMPPNPLPSGSLINIATASGDSCVLNFQQTLLQGSSLRISTGSNLVLSEGITIDQVQGLPVLKTSPLIRSVFSISAILGGIISNEGTTEVTARGLVWSTIPVPTILDNKTIDGAGIGSFTGNLTDLQPNTGYYVRAYATNASGTAYGNEIYFKTSVL